MPEWLRGQTRAGPHVLDRSSWMAIYGTRTACRDRNRVKTSQNCRFGSIVACWRPEQTVRVPNIAIQPLSHPCISIYFFPNHFDTECCRFGPDLITFVEDFWPIAQIASQNDNFGLFPVHGLCRPSEGRKWPSNHTHTSKSPFLSFTTILHPIWPRFNRFCSIFLTQVPNLQPKRQFWPDISPLGLNKPLAPEARIIPLDQRPDRVHGAAHHSADSLAEERKTPCLAH